MITNSKDYPRWYKDLSGYLYRADHEADSGMMYGKAHHQWLPVQSTWPLTTSTANLTRITTAEANEILLKPACRRLGGCLHEVGLDKCCCDDNSCDGAADQPVLAVPTQSWIPIGDFTGLPASGHVLLLLNKGTQVALMPVSYMRHDEPGLISYSHWCAFIKPEFKEPESLTGQADECAKAYFAGKTVDLGSPLCAWTTRVIYYAITWYEDRLSKKQKYEHRK